MLRLKAECRSLGREAGTTALSTSVRRERANGNTSHAHVSTVSGPKRAILPRLAPWLIAVGILAGVSAAKVFGGLIADYISAHCSWVLVVFGVGLFAYGVMALVREEGRL